MSGFQAPYYVGGSAAGWALTDYLTPAVTSPRAGADGVIVLELPQLADTERWLIDHAVVSCTSSTPTQVRWYEGAVADLYLLDGSVSGNFDVGEWPDGLQVTPGRYLISRWTGASPGAVATLSLQVRVLRRS